MRGPRGTLVDVAAGWTGWVAVVFLELVAAGCWGIRTNTVATAAAITTSVAAANHPIRRRRPRRDVPCVAKAARSASRNAPAEGYRWMGDFASARWKTAFTA